MYLGLAGECRKIPKNLTAEFIFFATEKWGPCNLLVQNKVKSSIRYPASIRLFKGRFWCGFTPQLMCISISIIFIIISILFWIDKTNNEH